MEHFLIAIIPSEDITIRIRELRTLIFKKFGLVSSRCLPEIIPVAFINKVIDKKLFNNLTISTEMNALNCVTNRTNDIFLQINNTDLLNSIIKVLLSHKTSGFITPEQGIYIGSVEKDLKVKKICESIQLKNVKNLSWKKNNLELIRIETLNNIWWEKISWETIWKQKIRFL